MCKKVTCPTCQRPSWDGCGAHVEQVLGDVPKSERCQGHPHQQTGDAPRRRVFARKK